CTCSSGSSRAARTRGSCSSRRTGSTPSARTARAAQRGNAHRIARAPARPRRTLRCVTTWPTFAVTGRTRRPTDSRGIHPGRHRTRTVAAQPHAAPFGNLGWLPFRGRVAPRSVRDARPANEPRRSAMSFVAYGAYLEPPADRREPLTGDLETDVAIVGAGYTGLSTALALRRAGVDAVVLEADCAGAGASGRNAGHLTPTIGKDLPTLLRLFGRRRAGALARFADAAV